MPYGYDRNPIDPYLRPMYPVAIEGIKDANAQGRWDQSQAEDKRRWEANRPFVDAQTKQMQFTAKKAEEAWNLYNSINGGQGDGKLAAAGIKPEEYTRAYFGLSARDPEIEADIPELGGKVKVKVSDYLNYKAKQKEAMPNVWVPSARQHLPANVAHNYPDFQKPEKPPAPQLVYRVGPDGKPYAEFVTPQPGMRVNDVYKPQSETGKYTVAQMLDDNRAHYGFLTRNMIDPTSGRVKKEYEEEYNKIVGMYQADQNKIAAGQKPSWGGGTTAEQDRDEAFLNNIRTLLGGPQLPGQPPAAGGSTQYGGTPSFRVDPTIDPNRPAIQNPDGSISTERTITIEVDGKYYLIPTIVDGKQLTPDQAVMATMAGKNNPVGEFNSEAEARAAAMNRSNQIGQKRLGQ